MSSCLTRSCGFDLEHIVKWQPYSNSNSSSPSSTLSDSGNSPVLISNQKPRTPRKRPNQTYNEAAALLSIASPNIFKIKHLTKRTTNNIPKFTNHYYSNCFNQPSELIFLNSQVIKKPGFLTDLKINSLCRNAGELEQSNEYFDDLDTESILNDEIEEGIDSIMGECTPISENYESNDVVSSEFNSCHKYKYPIGLGFGVKNGVKALKNADDWNWWKFPMVDVVNVKCEKSPVVGKKKKKIGELELRRGLFLKLDYDGVLNDWAGKGLPVPEDILHSSSPGGDIYAKAANIDLFSEDEDGGWKEYSATKKIRPVKNACSDKRPRCKGRFVKRPNSSVCDEKDVASESFGFGS